MLCGCRGQPFLQLFPGGEAFASSSQLPAGQEGSPPPSASCRAGGSRHWFGSLVFLLSMTSGPGLQPWGAQSQLGPHDGVRSDSGASGVTGDRGSGGGWK